MDPPCVLVAENIGERAVDFCPPNSLDDMQVRPTQSGAAHANNDIIRLLNLRIRELFQLQQLVAFQCFVEGM